MLPLPCQPSQGGQLHVRRERRAVTQGSQGVQMLPRAAGAGAGRAGRWSGLKDGRKEVPRPRGQPKRAAQQP